jgi:hypothetical protein
MAYAHLLPDLAKGHPSAPGVFDGDRSRFPSLKHLLCGFQFGLG